MYCGWVLIVLGALEMCSDEYDDDDDDDDDDDEVKV